MSLSEEKVLPAVGNQRPEVFKVINAFDLGPIQGWDRRMDKVLVDDHAFSFLGMKNESYFSISTQLAGL